jgi:hypothetical protein
LRALNPSSKLSRGTGNVTNYLLKTGSYFIHRDSPETISLESDIQKASEFSVDEAISMRDTFAGTICHNCDEHDTRELVGKIHLIPKESAINLEQTRAQLDRLLTAVNGITAYHRHGNAIPNNKLERLCNLQIEIEKFLEGE